MEVKADKKYQKRAKPLSAKTKKFLVSEILETLSGLKSDLKELKQYI